MEPLVLEFILGSKLAAFKLSPFIDLFPLLQMCWVGINENLFFDFFGCIWEFVFFTCSFDSQTLLFS